MYEESRVSANTACFGSLQGASYQGPQGFWYAYRLFVNAPASGVSAFTRSIQMLPRDYRSACPRRGPRPYLLTGRRAARFGLLLVCLAGAAIIAGCADGLDAFFNSGQTQPPPPGVLLPLLAP